MIKVLFFGPLRDIVRAREEACELPCPATLGELFEAYADRFPCLRELRPSIVFARNQQFCEAAAAVEDGDEIAFLPPVSGGSDRLVREVTDRNGNLFALKTGRIDVCSVATRIRQDMDGAVVTFECVVRNHNQGKSVRCLYYDYDQSTAIRSLTKLGADLARRHQISRLAIIHRVGEVPVGETSVVVVAAAPHRKPAFDAATEAMDRLKTEVAISKKEHLEHGAELAELVVK